MLANADTLQGTNNLRGHLFESFIARLLQEFGFDEPHERNVNVSSDGIELDVSVNGSFMNSSAIAEGKAYSTNVKAQAFTSFYGKLTMERFETSGLHGYLFAIPRLVPQGDEQARKAELRDSAFHYYNAERIVEKLVERGLVTTSTSTVPADVPVSDPAIVISEFGVHSCLKILDQTTHRADRVVVWAASPDLPVPLGLLDLLRESDYAAGILVEDGRSPDPTPKEQASTAPIIVPVRGSSSDFEYQFPASPAFFVGRGAIVAELRRVLEAGRGTFVLNAQSGWGKSSLALKAKLMAEDANGFAIVIDSRTATSTNFVCEALRIAAEGAAENGLIELPISPAWASPQSAIMTLTKSKWLRKAPLLVFFDQFENVFLDESTTRQFRDLSLLVNDCPAPLLVGFAWKTDLVGLTESHPYRLRDEIRSSSTNIVVEPMGARDVEALLRRLEKRIGGPLGRELRKRLREYSQGLPWLFKKLAGHVIKEMEEHNKTAEQLVNEALNVQSLFDSDLAGLLPIEQEAVRHVARFAPVSAMEVTERYGGGVIQSLLDRRLIVTVGEKLDTYWDIFRDFLNTGEIPIEDSYTIALTPKSFGPALIYVVEAGGNATISDIAESTGIHSKSVLNLYRQLRLLGVAAYEVNHIKLVETIVEAPDKELALRRTVARRLKRHKAYSVLTRLAERHGSRVPIAVFGRELPQAFPAVDAKPTTWSLYARVFAAWFDYTGLALVVKNDLLLPSEEHTGRGALLEVRTIRDRSSRKLSYLSRAPGPGIRLLELISTTPTKFSDLTREQRRALADLVSLDLAIVAGDGSIACSFKGDPSNLAVLRAAILHGLNNIPGGAEALLVVRNDPAADLATVGGILKSATGGNWSPLTTEHTGKHFRSWAKQAGVEVTRARPAQESRSILAAADATDRALSESAHP